MWRWCFFFAGQAPVYFLGEFIVHVCFLFAESLFFKVSYAFYYAVSVKVSCYLLHCVACGRQGMLMQLVSSVSRIACNAGRSHDGLLQKPAARLIRTCLLIGLYLWIFSDGEEWPAELLYTYKTVLKILFCMLLFCTADLIKAALAKMVAGHFHSSLHFSKMQDALNKVRHHSHLLCAVLSSPCRPCKACDRFLAA